MSAADQYASRRKIRYIDQPVQKWLLAALVVVEIVLAGGALWVIYLHLSEVIDQNLYRIHHQAQPIFPLMLREALTVGGWVVAANLAALLIADRIWIAYVDSILRAFTAAAEKTGALDFGADEDARRNHRLIELALAWRAAERERCAALRRAIKELDEKADGNDEGVRESARATLEKVRALLP